ncbi:ABC transporter substrate-binding protein [Taklimakanibacter deserti]|uniref:ABC transporter substrate-binding protein n=1 Tax=Taklimakanibacter deserti TaxID=2267839 RepID=UPI000E652408
MVHNFSRRHVLKAGAMAGAAAALPGFLASQARAQSATLNVFSPLPPDPAPPGAAKFSEEAFAKWQADNGATVSYEMLAWPQLHDRMATAFASGAAPWDITYNCGWVPEFQSFLTPYADSLPKALVDDLPPSSFATTTIDGKRYGAVFTLSLLTLFYNKEQLEQAGFKEPPKSWDELKACAKELTKDGRFGFVLNYGDPAGIGGTASYWMVFLQQAGGKMYGEDGLPVFKSDEGVAALQMMVDLMPSTDPGSISYAGINDATNVLLAGRAGMMMNWPFMWNAGSDPKQSQIVGKLASAVLPAGPKGSASIDGTDAWTITKASKNQEKAQKLIEFYLDAEVQKRQVLDTGWLPIRLSVLADPEVQAKAPNAAVVLDQAKHPYDSFVTADYNQVTVAVGTEVQKALQGNKTAAQAIADASEAVTAIVKRRG